MNAHSHGSGGQLFFMGLLSRYFSQGTASKVLHLVRSQYMASSFSLLQSISSF